MAPSDETSSPQRRALPYRFTVEETSLAEAFSVVAPGRGGWRVEICAGKTHEDAAEVIVIYAPRSTAIWNPDWNIYAEEDGVILTVVGFPPGSDLERFPTLRDALLHLCPLVPEQLAKIDALIRSTTLDLASLRTSHA